MSKILSTQHLFMTVFEVRKKSNSENYPIVTCSIDNTRKLFC